MMDDAAPIPGATLRYTQKREAIIAAATAILNRDGVKGMTLAAVAEAVGLITTSVTYYFKKKEALAAACFSNGIERLEGLVAEARSQPTASDRLKRLLELYLGLRARILSGDEPPMPFFSDIRALSSEYGRPVGAAYGELFRHIRAFFRGPGYEWLSRGAASARTQILLAQLNWSQSWLSRYDVEDYPRVCARMHDILINGLAAPGAVWDPQPLRLTGFELPDKARETFLVAGTRMINWRGYRGASVEKISAQLKVTKGSFYHHHQAKDDVVTACFERSFAVLRRAQAAARELPADEWVRLTSAAAALVEFQFSEQGPLLRTTALSALPEAIRVQMIDKADRLSDRFAGMISDGIAEGVLRPVDPFIAAQMLAATLNAAADLPVMLRGLKGEDAPLLYAKPMFTGLIGP